MNQIPKPRKKIVSKSEYVQTVSKRESLRFMGVCLLLLAGALGFVTLCTLGLFGFHLAACVFSVCSGMLTYFVGKWGMESILKSRQIKPVLPLTRANTADLPAPDTLVRPSEEPVQEQQTVLLRAVYEGQQTPVEQLVRAATGTPSSEPDELLRASVSEEKE